MIQAAEALNETQINGIVNNIETNNIKNTEQENNVVNEEVNNTEKVDNGTRKFTNK